MGISSCRGTLGTSTRRAKPHVQWNMETCKCPCAFDNNGRFLALLSSDGRLKVWDCTNGSLKHQYTPSSHLSATCTCLKWLNSSRGSETPRRKKQKTSHKTLSASSSSSVIALGTSSGDILIYNLAEGEIQDRLSGSHDDKVTDLAWSLNGDLYSCSSDKHIVEWNTGKSKQKSKWKADRLGVNSICVSPLGNCLLSAGRSIKLWDLETKQMLKKFTGHASPVSELLFLSSPNMSDSNGNHVPEKSINGLYFLSAADDERLLNVWYVDLENKEKNALVSLSLTDSPMAIDVSHYDSADKPVHVAVTSKDGKLHIFEKSLNGGGKKPVTPTRSIQLATPAGKNKPSSIPFLCAKLLTAEEPSVLAAYGSLAKPQFETLEYASFDKHTCLTREDNSSLPVKHGPQSTGPVDKADRNMMDVTLLGPMTMALARPSVAQNGDGEEQSTTTRIQNQPSIPEQSLEERLKAMNEVSKNTKESRKSIPTTSSMVQMLTQALHSQDRHLLEDVLQSGVKGGVIKNTVRRLPVQFIVPFIKEIIFKIQVSPNRGGRLAVWLKYILSIHMTYLMTVPNLVESLSNLYTMMETRVGVYSRLCKLQGRLDLVLSQVSTQSQAANEERMLNEPLAVYNEEDSDEEEVHFDDNLALEGEHSDSEEKWDEDMEDDDDDEDASIDSEDENAKGDDDEDDDDGNEDDDDDDDDNEG